MLKPKFKNWNLKIFFLVRRSRLWHRDRRRHDGRGSCQREQASLVNRDRTWKRRARVGTCFEAHQKITKPRRLQEKEGSDLNGKQTLHSFTSQDIIVKLQFRREKLSNIKKVLVLCYTLRMVTRPKNLPVSHLFIYAESLKRVVWLKTTPINNAIWEN